MNALIHLKTIPQAVLFTAALFMALPQNAWAGDCCGPHDSSCCPGNLVEGGMLGVAVEIVEDVAEENEKPASDNPEQALGKLLYELMKKLGYGGGDAEKSTAGEKPRFSSWKIKAIHKHLSTLKKGSKVSGKNDQGNFQLVVTAAAEKPFTRTFTYKADKKGKAVQVTYRAAKKGISITWKK